MTEFVGESIIGQKCPSIECTTQQTQYWLESFSWEDVVILGLLILKLIQTLSA